MDGQDFDVRGRPLAAWRASRLRVQRFKASVTTERTGGPTASPAATALAAPLGTSTRLQAQVMGHGRKVDTRKSS